MHRVPVFRTAFAAYAFVWQARRDFLALAAPAIVVLALLGSLWVLLGFPVAPVEGPPPNVLKFFAIIAVNFVVYVLVWVMFAVAWHRRYLVPHEVTTVLAALRWRRRQTGFLLIAIVIGLITMVLWIVGGVGVTLSMGLLIGFTDAASGASPLVWSGLVFTAMIVVALAIALVYARFSILFPSTAVDHRMSFRECWSFTRGNGWRLLFVIGLVAIPFIVVSLSISFALVIGYTSLPDSLTIQFVSNLVYGTLTFIGTAVGVSALSIAYRALVARGPTARNGG